MISVGVFADIIAAVLVIEWWLGKQNWINAKSIIALVLLTITIVALVIIKPFKRSK